MILVLTGGDAAPALRCYTVMNTVMRIDDPPPTAGGGAIILNSKVFQMRDFGLLVALPLCGLKWTVSMSIWKGGILSIRQFRSAPSQRGRHLKPERGLRLLVLRPGGVGIRVALLLSGFLPLVSMFYNNASL